MYADGFSNSVNKSKAWVYEKKSSRTAAVLGGDKGLIVKNRARDEAVIEYRIVDEVVGEA